MTLLDRYLLRRFLLCLGLSAAAMWGMAAVIDLIENIDTFIDHRASLLQIGRYYLYRSPYWILLTLPVTTLLATLFCLSGLARRSEIAAVKAAGVGLHRFLAPLYAFACLLAAATLLFTDLVVPAATWRYNTTRDEIRSYRRSDGSRRQVLLQDVDGQFLFARSYDHARRRAGDVTWERAQGHRTLERASARAASWSPGAGGWVLEDGYHHAFEDAGPVETAFDSLALTRLTLSPEDLARQQKEPEEMDFAELARYVRRARANGEDVARHLVDLHLKISFPFTCLVILLLAAPLGAGARRSGRSRHFGLGALICFAFYGSVKAGQALGWNGILAPWLGAWLANLVYGALAVLLLRRAHT